ncbi:hypothetical protein G9A89_006212 [Geosiphon pyriformis]|nr:hypothetical protein G9A89_006212 [Geosiphon pyriformis]
MFEVRPVDNTLLRKVVTAVKELVTEANFDCTDTGISLQAMDNSHVALVSVTLEPHAFEPYRCDRSLSLGVNLNSFFKILSCAGSDDIITLNADDTADVLKLTFEKQTEEKFAEYELKLMDIDQDHLAIPEQDYQCIAQMPSSEFSRVCRDCLLISDIVSLSISKETIKFGTSGELGKANIKIGPHGAEKKPIKIKAKKTVSNEFSMKYLALFSKSQGLAENVSLCLSESLPAMIEYKLGENGGFVRYFLAPKMQDDTDGVKKEQDDDDF